MLQVVRLTDKSILSTKLQRLKYRKQLSPSCNHESDYLLSTLDNTNKGRNTLYIALDENQKVRGILALSLNKPQGFPDLTWLIIEYLYIEPSLRGKIYNNSDVKASAILMARALDVASKIHEHIELDTIALELADPKLVQVYEEFGFEPLKHHNKKYWMGLKI